jgi:Flp pilus assembly pilin Flp
MSIPTGSGSYSWTDAWATRARTPHRAVRQRRRDVRQASLKQGGSVSFNFHREGGQGLAEYALIVSLIAVVAISALIFISGDLTHLLSSIGVGF